MVPYSQPEQAATAQTDGNEGSELHGLNLHLASPSDAMACGIGMVHQHFMLVQTMTVLENIILGAETTKAGRIDYDEAAASVQKLLDDFGFQLDLQAKIEEFAQIFEVKLKYFGYP